MEKISRKGFLKVAAAAAMSGVTAGALAACNSAASSSTAASGDAIYTAGTYTSTATGIGEVKVTMTFSETAITDVVIDASNETESIGGVAAPTLQDAIMAAQNAEIDNVSGATVTTNAVKKAAASCIEQAMGVASEEPAADTAGDTGDDWLGEEPDVQASETQDFDVVIIGAGLSGVCAARAAAEEGAKVAIVEKSSSFNCRSGEYALLNGSLNKRWGRENIVDEDVVVDRLMRECTYRNKRSILKKWASHAHEVMDWFIEAYPELTICDSTREAVTQEQFDLAAHFMGENTKANGANPAFRHSIFGGIAYCACCGAAMCSGGSVYNGERAKYWYLVCNNLSSRAQTRCLHGARIRYDDLMEVVRCDLNKLLAFGEDDIRTITENAVEQANASLGGEEPAVQIENIDKQTARLKKMIERSYRDNIAGMLSDDIHEEMVKKFGMEIDELTVRRKKLVAGETTAKEIRSAYGLFFDLAKKYTNVEKLDRDMLHAFVERIEIGEKILPEGRKVAGPRTPYRQSIRIFYRFIGEVSGDSLRQVQANRDREETAGAAGAF